MTALIQRDDHERWITRAGAAVILIALTIEGARSEDPPLAEFEASWPPAALLLAGALVMGLGVPRLARLGWRESATIAVEVCIKNTVLGLFVATQSLGSLEASVPIAVFMAFQAPVGIGVLVFYNVRRRRAERSHQHPTA